MSSSDFTTMFCPSWSFAKHQTKNRGYASHSIPCRGAFPWAVDKQEVSRTVKSTMYNHTQPTHTTIDIPCPLSHTLTHSHTLSLTLTHSHTLSHTLTHSDTLSHTVTHSHTLAVPLSESDERV